LIHLKLIFVQGKISVFYRWVFISQHHLLRRLSFLLWRFLAHLSNSFVILGLQYRALHMLGNLPLASSLAHDYKFMTSWTIFLYVFRNLDTTWQIGLLDLANKNKGYPVTPKF
jgi:hypothetical protein